MLILIAAILLVVLLVWLTIRVGRLTIDVKSDSEELLVAFVPLMMLSLYLVIEYRHWQWNIFNYGSLAPHAIAAALSALGLVGLLVRAHTRPFVKLAFGILFAAGWSIL